MLVPWSTRHPTKHVFVCCREKDPRPCGVQKLPSQGDAIIIRVITSFDIQDTYYTPVIYYSWLENGLGLKMYFLLKMEIFHCYVSLPEGIFTCHCYWEGGLMIRAYENPLVSLKAGY